MSIGKPKQRVDYKSRLHGEVYRRMTYDQPISDMTYDWQSILNIGNNLFRAPLSLTHISSYW